VRIYRYRTELFPGLENFIESGGGAALLAGAALLSLVLANLAWTRHWWLSLWAVRVGIVFDLGRGETVKMMMSLRSWVNEGLMAVFLFVVGLEIKKEVVCGCLRTPRSAALPCFAAVGGMALPVLFYVVANLSLPGGELGGWATPMATDIAFALGILGLFRNRMPRSANSFLLALATVDDMGAIVVVAFCYMQGLQLKFLALCAALCALLWKMHDNSDIETKYFAAAGIGLWAALIGAGLSAEVAGCITAASVPMKPDPEHMPPAFPRMPAREKKRRLTLRIDSLIKALAPPTSLFVLPVFALANLAVPICTSGGAVPSVGATWAAWTPAFGLSLGLVLGKPLGIFAACWLAVRLGIGELPGDIKTRHLVALAVLGGIGFTMCLFLVDRSLAPASQGFARLAVVASSVMMSVVATVLMRTFPRDTFMSPAAPRQTPTGANRTRANV